MSRLEHTVVSFPVQQRAELCVALVPPLVVSVALKRWNKVIFPPIFYLLNYSKHTIVFTHTGLFSSLMFCNSYYSGLANFEGLNTWTVSHCTGLHNHWDQDWETKRRWLNTSSEINTIVEFEIIFGLYP